MSDNRMILQPPACLLVGDSGTGKTSVIPTQLLCGLTVFVIVTEPDGVSSLLDACERLKAPIDKLHWAQCFPGSSGFMDLEDMITKISSMDQQKLSEQRDMGKAGFKEPAMRFLHAFSNFTCDRTGKQFGPYNKFDDTCSLNVDSFTGWCMIGWGCTVGYKPTANPGEWGIAQNFVHNMLNKVNSDRMCFFNMTAHIEKELDEMTGARRVMVSAIGAKLAPKIPKFFSEVIKCEKVVAGPNKADFTWSTLDAQMTLKNRTLPISSNLKADFKPIIEGYRHKKRLAQEAEAKALELAGGTQSPPSTPALTAPNATVVLPSAPMTPARIEQGNSPNKATQVGDWTK